MRHRGWSCGWRTRDGLAALTAGLLFIASTYVFHTTPLARVNGLALLFAVAGLACCLGTGAGPGAARRWCVFFLLALFTKQTTIDAVAAGLLALALRDVRVGLVVGLVIGFVGGIGLLLLDTLHGGAFWLNVVVGNVNPFDPKQAFDYYHNFLEIHLVMVALAGWQVVRAVRARAVGPFELYWLLSLVLAISVGKWGAGESYFLAPIAASAVLAGQAVAELHRRASSGRSCWRRWAGCCCSRALLFSHGPLYQARAALRGPGRAGVGAEPLARRAGDPVRPPTWWSC